MRTNADLPRDARVARDFGAEGIGLTRTEHMFFDEGRLEIFQEMIVAEDLEARKKALKNGLSLNRWDWPAAMLLPNGSPANSCAAG